MALHSVYDALSSSQHPESHEPRQVLAGSHDPYCPYHGALPVSPDGHVEPPMGSPGIGGDCHGLARARSLEQSVPQPRRVALLKADCLTKPPSLVPATRMRWIQAIVRQLPDIDDRPVAVRQMRHHAAPSWSGARAPSTAPVPPEATSLIDRAPS